MVILSSVVSTDARTAAIEVAERRTCCAIDAADFVELPPALPSWTAPMTDSTSTTYSARSSEQTSSARARRWSSAPSTQPARQGRRPDERCLRQSYWPAIRDECGVRPAGSPGAMRVEAGRNLVNAPSHVIFTLMLRRDTIEVKGNF